MKTKKEAENALYKLFKETRISDYKTKIKPQMDIINQFLDRTCEWKNNEDYYESKCGFTFQFSDDRDSLTDFDFKFCPKCGGKIEDKD